MISLIKSTFDKTDSNAIVNAIKKGKIGTSELVRVFEDKMAKFIGVRRGFATSSGTAALYITLKALNIKKGDEVILPSYTCLSLLNPIINVGAKPILVDNNFNVQKMDYNANFSEILNKVSNKTKAIIFPYMFGTPTDISRLKKTGITIIEDGTMALGTQINNKKIGSFGDIVIFSFNSKIISTGKGGMLLCNSKKIISRIENIISFEQKIVNMRIENNKNKMNIEYILPFEMSDIQASIGINQLNNILDFINKRRKIAKLYSQILNTKYEVPSIKETNNNTFFRYIIRINEPVNTFIARGLKEGIEFGRGVFPPIHYYIKSKMINTEKCINSLISVPIYPDLKQKEIHKILSFLRKVK